MNASAVSYPFEPLEILPDTISWTLSTLMKKLSNALFLEGLFDTLCAAGESFKHPPNSYAESMMSVLGRPLAIVQMGFSLEVANAPLKNQSTIAPLDPELDKSDITSYNFSMELGDRDNTLDGLVRYFSKKHDEHDPEACEMSSLLLFRGPQQQRQQTTPESPSRQPSLSNRITSIPQIRICKSVSQKRTTLKDRSSPLSWTRLLRCIRIPSYYCLQSPVSLSPWTVSNGVNRVSTFFRIGPLLAPGDVPAFLSGNMIINSMRRMCQIRRGGGFPMPVAVRREEWVWLQPYYLAQDDDPQKGATEYNFLDVQEEGQMRPWDGKESVPCTAAEGYLQMRRPFGVDDQSQHVG